jgi:hypothetical protein
MAVILTTAAKNWLAINAGVDNCFSPNGVIYKLPDEVGTRTGSTGDTVNAFYALHLVHRDTDVIVAGMNYTGFTSLNNGTDIDTDDVLFAYTNDGDPTGEPLYRYIAPTPICEWIISRGGWNAITSSDLITLAGAFLLHSYLGFPVTMAHIAGCTSYYLKRRSSGNMFTGCNFLT